LRIYFNNHYGGKAVVNAIQFREMAEGKKLSKNEKEAKQKILDALARSTAQKKVHE
jgi:hypothetical protein